MKKNFTVKVEMEERWIPHFMSMLKYMEQLGNMGASRQVGIVSDGDGDFRPKFNADVEYDSEEPKWDKEGNRVYDAG
jgi:hypothetical protein